MAYCPLRRRKHQNWVSIVAWIYVAQNAKLTQIRKKNRDAQSVERDMERGYPPPHSTMRSGKQPAGSQARSRGENEFGD